MERERRRENERGGREGEIERGSVKWREIEDRDSGNEGHRKRGGRRGRKRERGREREGKSSVNKLLVPTYEIRTKRSYSGR